MSRVEYGEYGGLVIHAARRLWGAETPNHVREAMIQDGFVGLMRAKSRFDPARGTDFSSFALPYIRGEIVEGIGRRQYGKWVRNADYRPTLIEYKEEGRPCAPDRDTPIASAQVLAEVKRRADSGLHKYQSLWRYLHGEQQQEIAKVCNRDRTTVCSDIAQTILEMRQWATQS